jgi:hypothetical protein
MDKPVKLCSLIEDHRNKECKDVKDVKDDEVCKIMYDLYVGCCKQNKKNENEDADPVIKK